MVTFHISVADCPAAICAGVAENATTVGIDEVVAVVSVVQGSIVEQARETISNGKKTSSFFKCTSRVLIAFEYRQWHDYLSKDLQVKTRLLF